MESSYETSDRRTSFGIGGDEVRPGAISSTPSHSHLSGLLWLHPHIGTLTDSLLEELEESWSYEHAFLLHQIVVLQIVCWTRRNKEDGGDLMPGAGRLPTLSHVMHTLRLSLQNIIPHDRRSVEKIVIREQQFNVTYPPPPQ